MLTQDEIHKIAAVESRHWWYRGMREMFFALLEPHLADRGRLRILDVGCGTGGNLVELSRLGDAHGIDADPLCVDYCRRKGLDTKVGTMQRLDEPPGSFDLVTIFDVVCQITPEQTTDVVRGVADVLAPGGLFAWREPGMEIAGAAHDRAVAGVQRFTTQRVKSILMNAGFELERLTYMNTLLFAPIVLQRRLHDWIDPNAVESDVKETAAPLNDALLGVLRAERHLLRFTDMPFGVSVFAVARKKM